MSRIDRAVLTCCALLLSLGIASESRANDLDLVCPCRIEAAAGSASVTFGMRNFRDEAAGELRLVVIAVVGGRGEQVGTVTLQNELEADSLLPPESHGFTPYMPPEGRYEILLALEEWQDGWRSHDYVWMEAPVNLPAESFSLGDWDILADADGDGVGDINERLAGTNPNNAASVPGDSTIDVLALYNQGMEELYDGDPFTRIYHVMTLASSIFEDSATGVRLRVVGISKAEVEDDSDEFSEVSRSRLSELRELHGADLVVMFRSPIEGGGICGWAELGGLGRRGDMGSGEHAIYANVFGDCGGSTTAHEIGHLMGLGHSFKQTDQGTFRWSRGHYVNEDQGTVMTYGTGFTDVFSDPAASCNGSPCGKDIREIDGAHAVKSLQAVRYQVERYRAAMPDSDGDGIVDVVDQLPEDPSDWLDADGDGIGNSADVDDDNDGHEDGADAFPFDPAEWADADGDGVGDNADAFPNDPDEALDTDGDGVGDNADPDIDGDGVANIDDLYPLDSARADIGSFRIIGDQMDDRAGTVLAALGDIDGDGIDDWAIGATYHDAGDRKNVGAVYLLSGGDLKAADAADGVVDRVVQLRHTLARPDLRSWKLLGEAAYDLAGESVAGAGDLNGDGLGDLVVGAQFQDGPGQNYDPGAVYILASSDLAAADAADGVVDGVVQLGHVPAQPDSWKLTGEAASSAFGASVAVSDKTTAQKLIIGAPGYENKQGAAYIVDPADLNAADAADGDLDGTVNIGRVRLGRGSWKLVGDGERQGQGQGQGQGTGLAVADVGDLDGDGVMDWMIGAPFYGREGDDSARHGAVHVLSSGDLPSADAADGDADGVIGLENVARQAGSWKLVGHLPWHELGARLPSAGGPHGDTYPNLLVQDDSGTHIVFPEDLPHADAMDGNADGVVAVEDLRGSSITVSQAYLSPVGDVQADGVQDLLGGTTQRSALLISGSDLTAARATSGTLELYDVQGWPGSLVFHAGHLGRLSAVSTGHLDEDGLLDMLMGFDGASTGVQGELYLILAEDHAVLDEVDGEKGGGIMLSNVAGDTDGDGRNNTVDRDDDNDGVTDSEDAFPLDASEWSDRDGDGVGDNADAFPSDWNEHSDMDGDGIGDNADPDRDGDGIDNEEDRFPSDTDNDGIDNADDADDDNDGTPDVSDALPLDATETLDTDGDGQGNNADADDDGDGVPDQDDARPLDTDNDGIDNADDPDDDNDGVPDQDDHLPLNPGKSFVLFHRIDFPPPEQPFSTLQVAPASGIQGHEGARLLVGAPWHGDNGLAYLLSLKDIAGVDREDGKPDRVLDAELLASQPDSWKFLGDSGQARMGSDVSWAGDMDADGRADLVLGAGRHFFGSVHIVPARRLASLDSADGSADRVIDMEIVGWGGELFQLLSGWRRNLGEDIAPAGDVDGDGLGDMMIGMAGRGGGDLPGTAGLLLARDIDLSLSATDMSSLAQAGRSLLFEGEAAEDYAGAGLVSGDLDGDGRPDLIIAAQGHDVRHNDEGAIYVVTNAELNDADEADGHLDGHIDLGRLASLPGGWKLTGEQVGVPGHSVNLASANLDGDAFADLVIGGLNSNRVDAVWVISGESLTSRPSTQATGLDATAAWPNSWKIVSPDSDGHLSGSIGTADLNGDGLADLLIRFSQNGDSIYILSGANLASADDLDGERDGVIHLSSELLSLPDTWKIVVGHYGSGAMVGAGDLDGDAIDDLAITLDGISSIYALGGADLIHADAADGRRDGVIELRHVPR